MTRTTKANFLCEVDDGVAAAGAGGASRCRSFSGRGARVVMALATVAAAALQGACGSTPGGAGAGSSTEASLWAGTTTLIGVKVGPVVVGAGWAGWDDAAAEPFEGSESAVPGK